MCVSFFFSSPYSLTYFLNAAPSLILSLSPRRTVLNSKSFLMSSFRLLQRCVLFSLFLVLFQRRMFFIDFKCLCKISVRSLILCFIFLLSLNMSINRNWRESDSLSPSLFSKKCHFGVSIDASPPTLLEKRGVSATMSSPPLPSLCRYLVGVCAHTWAPNE